MAKPEVYDIQTIAPSHGQIAAYATLLANALKSETRFLSVIGSSGRGGKTVETPTGVIPNLKVEVLEPVLCKAVPSQTDFEVLERLAGMIAQKRRESSFA